MRSTIVSRASILPRPAAWVWERLQKTNALRQVAAGFVEYRGDLPEVWQVGQAVDLQPKFVTGWMQILPTGSHIVEVTEVDQTGRFISTREHGGLVKSWVHHMQVDIVDRNRCYYSDMVIIEAGWATGIVRQIAEDLYAHRHRNWAAIAGTEP